MLKSEQKKGFPYNFVLYTIGEFILFVVVSKRFAIVDSSGQLTAFV